jgi:hypothetical protein
MSPNQKSEFWLNVFVILFYVPVVLLFVVGWRMATGFAGIQF